MADYLYGGSEEENAELRKIEVELTDDPDNFDTWERFVRAAEALEGGINRNSNPQAITTVRNVYDRFLAKFPLLFGYWKKYADLEFSITGTEAADMVYERGVASISPSVDLWTNYCTFKAETSHDPDVIRELFERGVACVGLDFLAHPFWDKYIEYEERVEAVDKIFGILGRVIHIPMHQYARYFERYRQLAQTRPVAELASPEILSQFRAELDAASAQVAPGAKAEAEIERDLRLRVDAHHLEIFSRTQTETTKRWTYESEIKRPYFHVTELDEGQLVNWRKYLDFEESEGQYPRIQFLYERCLVTCAHYDEFWQRYARWMASQADKEEEVRNIYQRACCLYVPIANPAIRLQYAYFEEMVGRVDVGKEIHSAILINMPNHVDTIVSLANMSRRQGGLEAAIEVYKTQLDSPESDMATKAALVAEWARLLWKIKGSPEEARQVYQTNQQYYLDSQAFWSSYLLFELYQPTSEATEQAQYDRIKQVVDDIRSKSSLPLEVVKDLVQTYMVYLLERGTKDAAKEYMTLDREVHGPASVAHARTGAAAQAARAEAQAATPITPAPAVPVPDPATAAAAGGTPQPNPYAYYQQPEPVNGSVSAPPPPPEDAPPAPPPVETKKKKLGWGKKPAATPLSVDDLVRKKREADAAAAKPKFLSRAQREKIALEKRAKEVEADRKSKSGTPSNANGFDDSVESSSNSYPRNGDSRSVPTGPRAMRNSDTPSAPAAMRPTERGGKGRDRKGEKRAVEEDETAAQAALVKQRYMGADQTSNFSAKKKRKRTTDRKFNFEWNAEEDTSGDYNPLYQHRHEANFFGRGRLAGFSDDVADSLTKKYARALEDRDREAGGIRAREILEMERRRREDSTRNQLDKHWSEKKLEHMRERDWRIFKEDFNIATKGGAVPNPMRSWDESGLPSQLMELVNRVGYKEPTPIQRAAIPIAMQSRDLIGVAVTGSGKTAAFLLPLLCYIAELPSIQEFEWRKNDGPYAIVLAPTRELAQQIEIEAKKFTQPLGFNVVSIVGGHSLEEQAYSLRDGAEIIIATPGRLVDCIERRMLVLSQCCYIIMDEADRMIDLGFEEPVNKILDALPVTNEKPDTDEAENSSLMRSHHYRQTMMYTATMPTAVERIARKYLRRPAIVTIGSAGEAVDTVEQRVELISGEDKRKKRLGEILASRDFRPPIIVFVNIKRNCDAIAREIKQWGYSSVTLHGSKTQDQREAALASVRSGATDVLVATDLAGRGIDVPDVSLVVNFNMATSIESYTHRIGRTGRAGKSGVAITFLGSEDSDVMYDLKQMLMKSPISRVPEDLRKHEAAQSKPNRGGGGGGGGFSKKDEPFGKGW
ncbi:dead box ATP-dependent rna helicase [Aspergillus candidus]|uniref:Pre-mRNA-splicing ATP-dependent RNA helicase PRP28 n=1 Tax=Aspergillus candidus TaxID=41067 RepID=A0A2I2FGT4_ASPCN|nr:dead box ATP-dependent rna helicase [Aspergillus candidus]PLB39846.1 dead box ATP-dependent rna helicase [Aspergillus candidus]